MPTAAVPGLVCFRACAQCVQREAQMSRQIPRDCPPASPPWRACPAQHHQASVCHSTSAALLFSGGKQLQARSLEPVTPKQTPTKPPTPPCLYSAAPKSPITYFPTRHPSGARSASPCRAVRAPSPSADSAAAAVRRTPADVHFVFVRGWKTPRCLGGRSHKKCHVGFLHVTDPSGGVAGVPAKHQIGRPQPLLPRPICNGGE